MEQEKLTLKNIIKWIIEHYDDMEAMDKINSLTFPFTSKYKEWIEKREKYDSEHNTNSQ